MNLRALEAAPAAAKLAIASSDSSDAKGQPGTSRVGRVRSVSGVSLTLGQGACVFVSACKGFRGSSIMRRRADARTRTPLPTKHAEG
jgi:hypothetical protein